MEKQKIPITALSMLKNILGIECKRAWWKQKDGSENI